MLLLELHEQMNFISIPRIPIMWRYAGILFLLPFMACQTGEMPLTRFEDSPIIDRLLDSAPHFVVNTDIEPENWIATTRLGIPNGSLILGRPHQMVAVGDSIYISEWLGHHFFAVGNDEYLSRKIGAQGEAPGEFNYTVGVDYNGSQIFVKELGRIQIFTETFEYVGSFFNTGTGMRHHRIAASPDYIFLECIGVDWLVCPYSTSPPHAWAEPAKLLPVLDLPDRSAENSNLITVSPEGDRIAVAYRGLPYLFVYDGQFRHLKTIRFEGSSVRSFNPIAAPPGGSPAGMEPGIRVFTRTIRFLNSRYLIAYAGPERHDTYIFDLSGDDYRMAAKMIFHPISDTKTISPGDFLLHGDHLYVSSKFEEYVYGYPFDLE